MSLKLILPAVLLGLLCAMSPAAAQEIERRSPFDIEQRPASDYTYAQPTSSTPTPTRPDPLAIIQQKSQERAAQRMARLEALNWYGMSNSRPTASRSPYTSLYSPVWQMPGGRPFAWYASGWPAYRW
jgi:hypothetical protein